MKKLLVGSLVLISALVGTSAGAADLPRAPVYKAAPIAPPVPYYNWTGLYVGGHGGAAWLDGDTNRFADPGNTAYASCNDCGTGFNAALRSEHRARAIGGFHLGFNAQFAPNWLVGVEGDYTF